MAGKRRRRALTPSEADALVASSGIKPRAPRRKNRRSKGRDYTSSVKNLFKQPKRKRTLKKGSKKKLTKVLRLAARYRKQGVGRSEALKRAWAKGKAKSFRALNYKTKHKRAVIDKDLGL